MVSDFNSFLKVVLSQIRHIGWTFILAKMVTKNAAAYAVFLMLRGHQSETKPL